jgi:hypothetical protein
MPLPLVPIAILALTGGAWYQVRNKGKLTPERKAVFDAAMNTLRDSAKLRDLAASFAKEGLPREAALLNKRANIRDLPPEVTKARNEAFKKGMKSTNFMVVMQLAEMFQNEGAIGAAENLRMHAEMLMTTTRPLPHTPIAQTPVEPVVVIPEEPVTSVTVETKPEEPKEVSAP